IVGIEQLRSGIRALAVGDSYKSHLLVGADGVNGVTARELGIRTKWHQERVALCFVADVPLSRNEITNTMQTHDSEPAIELYFGMVPWGYGWCFPKSAEYSIGLGCRFDKSHSLESAWDMLVARIEHEKGIELDLANRTSYRVPLGGKIDRCVARRSMLIGDAAGLVSPMTGEGISYAIESGVLAARTSIDAVRTKSPLRIKEYENQVKGHMSRELADLRWLTGILHRSKRNVDLVCQIADEDPIMREYLTDLLARTRRFSDLKISLVKRLLARHPLKAARLGLR
ncbi:MAG: FAD-dependent monooxygenase, partial [Promethearchaeota archaeon]